MRKFSFITFVGLAALTIGCSKSEEQAAVAPAPVPPPDAAVTDFLEAIRVGDDKKAEAMLTDLARQKTAQMDLMVAPAGSSSASFKIAVVEVIEGQVAHVSSIWTDTGDDGKPQTNEFVWALRLEPQGWRIAGVAVALFPNQPPLLLDFEDPADMLRKQQMAEAEMQRQMNPQAAQPGAAQPGTLPAGANPQAMQAGGTVAAQAAPGQVQPASGTSPANPTQPNSFTPAPGTQVPGTATPGAFAVDPTQPGSQIPAGNLPQSGGFNPTPVSPAALPSGSPVPLQAEQPQPGQPLPR
jgi:hypothetical protein